MEKFKQIYIDNEPTIYAISTKGRVMNTKRKKFLKPHILAHRGNKVLATLEPNNVYMNYALYHKGKYYYKQAHRLVAEYFIPIPQKYLDLGLSEKDLHVDHRDNVRYHNDVDNLQWLTPQENIDKVTECNRQRVASGSKHGMCHLSDEQLDQVGRLLEEDILTQQEISIVTEVPYNTILEIRAGRRFKYLSEKYNFQNYSRYSRKQYTREMIEDVCHLLETGKYTVSKVSRMTGVSRSTVSDIVHGRSWKNVASNYDFTKFLKKEKKDYGKNE